MSTAGEADRVMKLANYIGSVDEAGLEAIINELHRDPGLDPGDSLRRIVFLAWAKKNPRAALDKLEEPRDFPDKTSIYDQRRRDLSIARAIGSDWAGRDPKAAVKFVNAFFTPDMTNVDILSRQTMGYQLAAGMLAATAARDITAAGWMMRDLGRRTPGNNLSEVKQRVVSQGVLEMQQWLEIFPGRGEGPEAGLDRFSLAYELGFEYSKRDMKAGADFIFDNARHDPLLASDQGIPINFLNSLHFLLTAWKAKDPAGAAAYVEALPERHRAEQLAKTTAREILAK
ncbi:hypothetical protein OKA04_00965 [Luteolibacter flavescens]|uniref:Uncharacterized protein n=1 Tax=Luteolibacter flavescens TaxID=1859460 RepID=A0ABT3FI79_9BACT|nr:hypothetical protein [Luteolibacter flavescens]MCW1883278.1 hypothetical protein [Luteolibacter flavescens]